MNGSKRFGRITMVVGLQYGSEGKGAMKASAMRWPTKF